MELLGSLRSHRSGHDRDLIRHGQSRALVRGWCGDGDTPGAPVPAPGLNQLELELEVRRQGGRQARRNGKVLERQLDLVGPLRCVGFSALDLELVRGSPPSGASGSIGWCCNWSRSTGSCWLAMADCCASAASCCAAA